jgi:hypothetical protein
MEDFRNAYKILGGKTEERRPFERPKRRYQDNIKLKLTEILWKGVD